METKKSGYVFKGKELNVVVGKSFKSDVNKTHKLVHALSKIECTEKEVRLLETKGLIEVNDTRNYWVFLDNITWEMIEKALTSLSVQITVKRNKTYNTKLYYFDDEDHFTRWIYKLNMSGGSMIHMERC